jgi:hypothetical protein
MRDSNALMVAFRDLCASAGLRGSISSVVSAEAKAGFSNTIPDCRSRLAPWSITKTKPKTFSWF